MSPENIHTAQEITQDLEDRIDKYVKSITGDSAVEFRVPANRLARIFVGDAMFSIHSAIHKSSRVERLKRDLNAAVLNRDEVLFRAIEKDIQEIADAQMKTGLSEIQALVTKLGVEGIASLKSKIDDAIFNERTRRWGVFARNALCLTLASTCIAFGGYNIYKSF